MTEPGDWRTLEIDYSGDQPLDATVSDVVTDALAAAGIKWMSMTDVPAKDTCCRQLETARTRIADLETEVAILLTEVEFGIEKVLRMHNLMSEQAAVHHKRELLLEKSARNAAHHLANLKVAGGLLHAMRAERDALAARLDEVQWGQP